LTFVVNNKKIPLNWVIAFLRRVRVTRCVCYKVAQNVARNIFCQIDYITFTVVKISP
jgi:hypothetical protein